ncbi:hypothetical protein D052_4859 [Vibrio parahaemolyticus 10290]|nr:hypothetical protein D052_4859 [Vibrio parahaemolyticus 10290]
MLCCKALLNYRLISIVQKVICFSNFEPFRVPNINKEN